MSHEPFVSEHAVIDLAEAIARQVIQHMIRENGQKIGAYKASEIAQLKKSLVRQEPWFGEQARRLILEGVKKGRMINELS